MNQSYRNQLKSGRKRWIIVGSLGLILGLIGIWFCTTVYDPFVTPVDDLLVFAPEDADVVLVAPDLPTLVKSLENRAFLSNLEESRGIRRFLSSERAADSGLLPAIREGYDALGDLERRIRAEAGFELLGEVSGRKVVASGRFDEAGEFTFFAAIAPEAGSVLMGVNVFLDEFLFGLFVEGRLEGVTVDHFNWGARIRFDDPTVPSLAVARVADVVLAGTAVDDIAREVKNARTEGVPSRPSPRYADGWAWKTPSGSSMRAIVRRKVFDDEVAVGPNYLVPLWGAPLAGTFDRALPAFEDRDVRFGVTLDHLAEVRASVGFTERAPRDVFSDLETLDLDASDRLLSEVLGRFPHHVFGYACLAADPAHLLEFALRETPLVDSDEKDLLFDFLGESVPRFRALLQPGRPIPDLTRDVAREVRAAFGRQIGIAMFRKMRDGDASSDSTAGHAVILPVRDAKAVESLIAEIDVAADRPLERYDDGGMVRWILARSSGIVNDPDATRPGFALMGSWFIVTNWHPIFQEIERVDLKIVNSFSTAEIEYALDELPPDPRGFFFIDGQRLYDFMDQAKKGWARERSEIDEAMKVNNRRVFEAQAFARGLKGEHADVWIRQQYDAWLRRKQRELDPAKIEAEIDTNLDYFRDAFDYFFSAVGLDGDGRLALDMRLAAREGL